MVVFGLDGLGSFQSCQVVSRVVRPWFSNYNLHGLPFAQESSLVILTKELFPVQNNISSIIIMVTLSRGRHPHLGGLTAAYNKHNNKKHDTHNS